MYIFYDFETSTLDLAGQILTYSFIVTNQNLDIQTELNGKIKLNRTQLPDIDAILTNRIDVIRHQVEAEPEIDAARRIYEFISQQVDTYFDCLMIGFNSNQFDLQFFRNLLIRYGINPYFNGHLQNRDVLHFARFLALANPDSFPLQVGVGQDDRPYYSFRLEGLANAFHILDAPQTHDARDDVVLTIRLVRVMTDRFGTTMAEFVPFEPIFSKLQTSSGTADVGVQYELGMPGSERIVPHFWMRLLDEKKNRIVVDLTRYAEQPDVSSVRYWNANKQYYRLDTLTPVQRETITPLVESVLSNQAIMTLTADAYFALIKKDWDIEYQIHEMGFEHIGLLNKSIQTLLRNPAKYTDIIDDYRNSDRSVKYTYMITLFNRVYLNYHPNPDIRHVHRYMVPRYVTGAMLQNPARFESLGERLSRIRSILGAAEYTSEDKILMSSLEQYMTDFVARNQLTAYV